MLANRERLALPGLAVVTVFAGLGVYFLRGSHALVVNDAGASITLAPEVAAVNQGEFINVAINIDTNDVNSTSVKAVVRYSVDALQLESVRQACPQPDFDKSTEDAATPGVVRLTCGNQQGFTGQKTIGYLVFKGVDGKGDAALTVAQESEITGAGTGKALARTVNQSRMSLLPSDYSDKHPRAIQHHPAKAGDCSDAPAGYASCGSLRSDEPVDAPSPRATNSQLGPFELHTAYQLPCTPGGPVAAVCATPKAYDRTIAIINVGSYKGGVATMESDLTKFSQQFGIPPCTQASGCLKVVGQTGGAPPGNDAGDGPAFEMAMDVQAAHGICQTCKILAVNANTNAYTDMQAALKYAASTKPYAISMSWYTLGGPSNDEAVFYHPGMFMVGIAGDKGVSPNTTDWPADYGSVLVATGTSLRVNNDGTWASEPIWNYPSGDPNVFASGGGCSSWNTAPAWQTARADWKAVGCGDKRAYGDVSMNGGCDTPMYMVQSGAWTAGCGTSLSAPLIAGVAALAGPIDANTLGARVPYDRNNGQNTRDIHEGNNCITTYKLHCTSGFGFDTPGGLGSPLGTSAFGPMVSDSTAPTVAFGAAAPAEGATIKGKISIPFDASDGSGIDHLTAQIDTSSLMQLPTSPYALSWDTTAVADGTHKVTVTAYDKVGNTTSVSRTFVVRNAVADTEKPVVAITAPADNATISGSAYQATVTATDNTQVSVVAMQVDGGAVVNDTTSPYGMTIDATKLAAGNHTMTATATDAAGNSATATRTFKTVVVTTPTPTPPVTITGDITGDGKVNLTDLSRLLSAWNTNNTAADLNKSGKVDLTDLSILLAHWTG